VSLENGSENNWVELNRLAEAEVQVLEQKTGLNLAGYQRILDSASIRHTLKLHGNPLTEARRGQIAVSLDDFLYIPSIVNSFEELKYLGINRRGMETLLYRKQIGDVYFYVEEVRKGRKKLCLNTLYKKKATE